MSDFTNFIMTALPWIGLGLWVAASTVQQSNTNKGKKSPLIIKLLALLPAVLFFILAALQRQSGQTQSASTNIVLAIFIILYAMYADWKEIKGGKK